MTAQPNARFEVYVNTPEEAAKIGWDADAVKEYLFGDKTLPFVRHDTDAGTFTYVPTNAPDAPDFYVTIEKVPGDPKARETFALPFRTEREAWDFGREYCTKIGHPSARVKEVRQKPVIEPTEWFSSGRSASLTGTSVREVSELIGLPTVDPSDDDKTVNEWRFLVGGEQCAVWDYGGSQKLGTFSAYGPKNALIAVFSGLVS